MARRELHANRGFNKAIGDLRRQAEKEERPRNTPRAMVPNRMDSCRGERQQLLDKKNVQKRPSATEQENKRLKADLHKVREELRKKDKEVGSLHHRLTALEGEYDAALESWREAMKTRDEEIIALQQSLHAHEEEKRKRATLDSGLQSMEERWQKEVSQLQELLTQKDKEVSRADNKRRARNKALVDTLALLDTTQTALTKSEQKCEALEVELCKQLAEKDESHRKELAEKDQTFGKVLAEKEESCRKELSEELEKVRKELSDREDVLRRQLSEMEGTFQRDLSDRLMACKKQLSDLCESWERKAEQWEEERRELKETLVVKEKIWSYEESEMKEELQLLRGENSQLQKFAVKNEPNTSFWSCCFSGLM